ncbi:MAG: beta-eliminating lyase-related protein [Actinomycetota bacterium]|nr:beta-eliminating lyase-related protein [Actinomycetota bacterium]
MGPTGLGEAELAVVRAGCTRFLNGHGVRGAAEMLATIPTGIETDRYGSGGVVAELEAEVASLLGKAAALFLPSGTMAQQATLRVHAERTGRRAIVFHPACHLDWHEGRGYQRLHGLVGVPAATMGTPLTRAGLDAIHEPPAALLIELPQRDLGGTLPAWDDLVAQVAWARERGAAVHMDGARLWEATAGYRRPASEIAALFDTVYVSFYKGLGGIAGCCVAGDADVVAEVSEWRTRHGGRVFALWPYAGSALGVLRSRLPRMPAYHAQALAIASAVGDLPGVDVLPDPPQAPMMHLQLSVTVAELEGRALAIAQRDKIWTFPRPFSTVSPRLQRIEVSVGEATMGFTPAEVRDLIREIACP